jgi:hypothetical protein
MESFLTIVAVVAVWYVLFRLVLPRLGVRT